MSRYPIVDVHYHPFLLNGYLHMLMHGDWFGGKGIGLCRINVQGFIVDIYTTHVNIFLRKFLFVTSVFSNIRLT